MNNTSFAFKSLSKIKPLTSLVFRINYLKIPSPFLPPVSNLTRQTLTKIVYWNYWYSLKIVANFWWWMVTYIGRQDKVNFVYVVCERFPRVNDGILSCNHTLFFLLCYRILYYMSKLSIDRSYHKTIWPPYSLCST